MNFEEYLGEKHAEQYTGLDDEMSDDFVDWMERLDNQEIIEFADEFAKKERRNIIKTILNETEKYILTDKDHQEYKDAPVEKTASATSKLSEKNGGGLALIKLVDLLTI